MNFLTSLFGKKSEKQAFTPCLPAGQRIYAVGDIHGRLDLLQKLHMLIVADYEASGSVAAPILVHLGDYIDRGSHNKETIDYLLSDPLPHFWKINLKGNHEAALLTFQDDPAIATLWLKFGGQATLQNYGITPPSIPLTPDTTAALYQAMQQHIPAAHFAFFKGLKTFHEAGDYLFVHAGIDPDAPHDRDEEVLLWIREPFLQAKDHHGKVVVHGHSIHVQPQQLHNRIGIDTGAYATGKLTALVLEGEQQYFLQT
jgi:serine/threonine protein phosphatase 1